MPPRRLPQFRARLINVKKGQRRDHRQRPRLPLRARRKPQPRKTQKAPGAGRRGQAMPAHNSTCDIYHAGNAPPAAPDQANIQFHLSALFQAGSEGSEGDQDFRWTHIGYFDASEDIRDAWPAVADSSIYVPDKDGTKFNIIFIELVNRDTPAAHKRVFLERQAVTWPSDEV